MTIIVRPVTGSKTVAGLLKFDEIFLRSSLLTFHFQLSTSHCQPRPALRRNLWIVCNCATVSANWAWAMA